jgi:PAS domain S-box-containing protein
MEEEGTPVLSAGSNVVVVSLAALPNSILSALPIGLVLLDEASNIRQINDCALSLFAVATPDELLARILHGQIVLLDTKGLALTHRLVLSHLFPQNSGSVSEVSLLVDEQPQRVLRITTAKHDEQHRLVLYEDISEQTQNQALADARDRLLRFGENHPLSELFTLLLDEAERLTASNIAFFHTLAADQKTLTSQAVSHSTRALFCQPDDVDGHARLAQGSVWADCVREKTAVVHNDDTTLPHRRGLPEGHAPVIRELVVPIVRMGRVVALMGVGNKPRAYTAYDTRLVTLLSDLAWDIAERKRAEELLHRTNTALNGSLNAVVVTDVGLNVTYLNPAFLRLFRLHDHKNELGRSLLEYWQDPPLAERIFQEMFDEGFSAGELFGKRTDGSVFLVEFTGSSIRGRDGRAIGLYTTFIDVTDYHRVQTGLRDAEEKFTGAFHVISDAVHITDFATGKIIEVNEGFERGAGYTRQEVIGKTTVQLNFWYEPQERHSYYALLAKQGFVHGFQARLRVKDGRILWAEHSSEFLQLSGRRCIVTITRDVTAQRAAAAALEESEQRFRNMFDLHDAAMLLIDPENGTICSANAAAERYFGIAQSTLIDRRIPEICTISEKDCSKLLQAAISGTTKAFGLQHRAHDGNLCEAEVYASPIHYLGQTVLYAILHDVTERRKLEEHLRRVQRMDCLGNLASGVAHDINNVLSAILAHATVQRDDSPSGSQLADDLSTIVQACIRGRTLVRSLLDFARPKLSEQRSLSLNTLVEEEVRLLSRTTLNRITLKLELAQNLGTISGDSSALSHALMNLCINAVDAMPEGGTLTIGTRNLSNTKVELRVADTGHGMTPEVLEKAIDPFFSTKPQGKGTGLGLAMVYSAAEAHAAKFEISSIPGQGTVVTLTFPTVNAPIEEAPESQVGRFFAVALSILIVDDDWIVLRGLARQLTRLGHHVTPCTTGIEALALLEETDSYDLVVLDVNMPDLGGYDVFTRAQSTGRACPVLFVTGRPDEALQQFVAEHPGTAMLAKPFTQGELRTAIRQLCGRHQRDAMDSGPARLVPFGQNSVVSTIETTTEELGS